MNTEEAQKVLKWVKMVLVVLAIFLAVEALGAFKSLRDINPAYNSISVNGEGEVISIPDIATFSFTVSDDSKTVSDAQSQVTRKIDEILAGLKDLGIEEKDIKTADYSIWPKYTYTPAICTPTYCPPSRQVQDGYTVNHNVTVKVRKTENVGEAIALVGERGATNLSGISFTVDDIEKVLNEARAKAIDDAKSKAKQLSKELGVRLVRIVSFYDNTDNGPGPYYPEALGGDVVRTIVGAPTIPVGENKVVISVTIVYEIK